MNNFRIFVNPSPSFPLSYDLSPLYDAGNLEWAGQLNGTQTAIYVRACGQVELGTEECDHTAGVCGVVVSKTRLSDDNISFIVRLLKIGSN